MFNDFEVTASKTRELLLENGNKLRMTRNDPYGLITFSLEHGQLPESFRGSYTDWHQAEIAAKKYTLLRQDVLAEIKEKNLTKK